jgi:hypothetical protein
MKKNTWFAIGLGLGIAAAGVFILKKTGLLGGECCDCDYEDDMYNEYYDYEKDCVITPTEEEANTPSDEAATEEISGKEKSDPEII